MGDILSPRMMDSLVAFFPKRLTAKEPTYTDGTYGKEITAWADVTGCASIPASVSAVTGIQVNGERFTYGEVTYNIVLSGDYSQIKAHWRLVDDDDGTIYDVKPVLVQMDAFTKLQATIVEVS